MDSCGCDASGYVDKGDTTGYVDDGDTSGYVDDGDASSGGVEIDASLCTLAPMISCYYTTPM